MSDNKKYYYLKLKEDFFKSDTIVVLESMPDGIIYTNILLKMYLLSLKNDGRLILREDIPYNAAMLAPVLNHQIGTVERAISIFIEMKLIDVLPDNLLYMTDIELFIGQSSTEAERIKKIRLANKNQLNIK